MLHLLAALFFYNHFLGTETAQLLQQSFTLSQAVSFGAHDMVLHYMRLQRATCWRQLGQVWMTSLQPSTQKGIRQQPRSHLQQVGKLNQNKSTDSDMLKKKKECKLEMQSRC